MFKKASKVMIVDDHAFFRQGLVLSLSTMEGIQVVGEADNGNTFLMKLPVLEPEIVILDIKMPEMDGIQAAIRALQINKHLKIIVMTMFDETAYFNRMVEIGVSGFLLKTAEHSELERAIRRVQEGDTYFSPTLIKTNENFDQLKMNSDRLTAREIEVLHEICHGLSNQEISDKLCISRRAVDGHRASLMDKTASKNTVALVVYAIKHGLFKVL